MLVANYCKNTDSTQIRTIVWIGSCINEKAWSKIDASCTTQGYLSVHALQLPRFRFFVVMKKIDFCISRTTPFAVMETQENREKLFRSPRIVLIHTDERRSFKINVSKKQLAAHLEVANACKIVNCIADHAPKERSLISS